MNDQKIPTDALCKILDTRIRAADHWAALVRPKPAPVRVPWCVRLLRLALGEEA